MNQRGFTIPELIIVMAIFAILTGLVSINLFQAQNKASLHAALDTLVSDIRQQQIKTMTGDTEGTSTITNFGIYFQANKYTLFHGTAYASSDPANFDVKLDNTFQLTNDLFPGTTLLFSKGSGEVSNFINGSNAITIKDTSTNEMKTITVNKYGVIILVN